MDGIENILSVFVWPLLSVLVPVLVAVLVAAHAGRTTLKAVERQISEATLAAARVEKVREIERSELAQAAATDRRRQAAIDLLAEVTMHTFDAKGSSDSERAADVVSVRRFGTLLSVQMPADAVQRQCWVNEISLRYSAVRSALELEKPFADYRHTKWLSGAQVSLLRYLTDDSESMAAYWNLLNEAHDKAFGEGRMPLESDEPTQDDVDKMLLR